MEFGIGYFDIIFELQYQNSMNLQVRDSFHLYKELVVERKTLSRSTIVLAAKANNANFLSKSENAYHETILNNVQFIVECRTDNLKHYGIKLRFEQLCPEPFLRFDSDGPAHRNKCSDTPLEKQLITTPHFNAFDEHGCYIAYKTPPLENPAECNAIIDDINFGVVHFCHVSNTRSQKDEFPIVEFPTLFGNEVDSSDPHDSIKFDIN